MKTVKEIFIDKFRECDTFYVNSISAHEDGMGYGYKNPDKLGGIGCLCQIKEDGIEFIISHKTILDYNNLIKVFIPEKNLKNKMTKMFLFKSCHRAMLLKDVENRWWEIEFLKKMRPF